MKEKTRQRWYTLSLFCVAMHPEKLPVAGSVGRALSKASQRRSLRLVQRVVYNEYDTL